jgi:1,2-phenylacetyl-CoA epoxidase catalytic subunit
MKAIKNKAQLEQEIYRLQLDLKSKEKNLALINAGVRSFFHQQTTNKSIVTTTLSIMAGFLVERVILRKSNILVKYGIAQLAMGLVSQLAEQNWHPEFITKIQAALQKAITDGNTTDEVEE